jgi:hypothetical protein
MNSCQPCCIAKSCYRHNSTNGIEETYGLPEPSNDLVYCIGCGDWISSSLTDKFLNEKINKVSNYCESCYKKYTPQFNNLIDNSDADKTKLNIEYIKINKIFGYKASNKVKEEQVCAMVNAELEKYTDKIITWPIIQNDLKKIKDFELSYIPDGFSYKCPECEDFERFCDISICETCEKIICDQCVKLKSSDYCIERYCSDCYVDTYKNLYDKYKNQVLTADMLKNDTEFNINDFDLGDFEGEGYTLQYKCPICTTHNNFSECELSKCDRCNTFTCDDCVIIKYIPCHFPNCRYCINRTCYNSRREIYCSLCASDYNIIISDDEEEMDDNDEEETIIIKRKKCTSPCELATETDTECSICYINKKKYACVPCGHLCMCGECANKIGDQCPMCKTKVNTIIKIYS